jgi:hypothetical protein
VNCLIDPTRSALGIALLCIIVLAIAGCGGGGGSDSSTPPAYSEADLNGVYQVMCVRASQTSMGVFGNYGHFVADGMGMSVPTLGENSNGLPSAPMMGAPEPYTVGSDGTISIDDFVGKFACGTDCALLATTTAGDDPGICILLRRDGAYSNNLLTGNYHMGAIQASLTVVQTNWTGVGGGLGPVVFDGMGGGAFPDSMQNENGTQSTPPGGAIPYSIAADGVAEMGGNWTGIGLGAVSSDGSLACFSGGTDASRPFLSVFLQQGAGLSAATFSGDYRFVALRSDPANGRSFASSVGSATADGAGSMSFPLVTNNSEQVITVDMNSVAAYTVGATGILGLNGLVGAVSPDGKYAYITGGAGAGDDPILVFFARK